MKLTKRQERIARAVPPCGVLADVGCDHGYIGMSALLSGRAQKVVFCDVSAASLQKAKKLAETLRADNCGFVCGDGLEGIECDCAVIAGLGGKETIAILQQAERLPQHLVLQPMKNVVEVRDFLCESYFLERDEIFFDKKFYNLITARRGKDSLSEEERYFGKTNIAYGSEDFAAYVAAQREKYQRIWHQSGSVEAEKMLALLNRIK